MRIVRIFDNLALLAQSAAHFVYSEMLRIMERSIEVSFLISGKLDFPLFFYKFATLFNSKRLLKIDIYWFLTDGYWAVPGNSRNHEQRLREALFDAIRPPSENVFSWQVGYQAPFPSSVSMNTSIENFFVQTGKKPGIALLSMDEEGNIASLFPGAMTLAEEAKMVPLTPVSPRFSIPVYHKKDWYFSLTPQIINASEVIIVFILGKNKQAAWEKYLAKKSDSSLSWIRGKQVYFYTTRDIAGDFIYKYGRKKGFAG